MTEENHCYKNAMEEIVMHEMWKLEKKKAIIEIVSIFFGQDIVYSFPFKLSLQLIPVAKTVNQFP